MDNFEDASIKALNVLDEKLGFQLCMVTRTEGDDWTVIHKKDHGYDVYEGDVLAWRDSFCIEMVKGNGPSAAPDSTKIAVYSNAAINNKFEIGSYLGAPIKAADGSVFGTICCIDPKPKSESLVESIELINLIAHLLGLILQLETKIDEEERRSERLQAQALTDALTGLYNRAGWLHFVAKEEARYLRLRSPSTVIAIDLDGLKKINDQDGHAEGDKFIKKASEAIFSASREQDIVARLGGDEFAIIGVNCDRNGGHALKTRVEQSLKNAGIDASVGISYTTRDIRIEAALAIADLDMYEQKRSKYAATSD